MPNIDLSILNQRQTPAFYADVFANRPAAGFVGRIFVSTNTFAFYRDNGTGWDLIGGPGTGTITGSGANGQVSYWNGASTITGSNNLFFDAVNGHLGIGTITPGTALDVKHDQNTVVQLEQVTATNDTRIAFINNGVGLWRLGAFYNAGANDFGLFDIAASTQPVTVKRTTGQTFIGASTTSSGLFVVNTNTNDNHIVVLGNQAPSIRIRTAGVAASLQCGVGLSTTTNNFIQGATGGEFCIYNDSTAASPILFGINATSVVLEAARISSARNFLLNTTTDSGQRLIVNGSSFLNGNVGIGVQASAGGLSSYTLLEIANGGASIYSGPNQNLLGSNISWSGGTASYKISNFASLYNQQSGSHQFSVAPSGTAGNTITFTTIFTIKSTGVINIANVPTSAAGLVSGDVYRTANVLNIVP